jgi:hypothetical protein
MVFARLWHDPCFTEFISPVRSDDPIIEGSRIRTQGSFTMYSYSQPVQPGLLSTLSSLGLQADLLPILYFAAMLLAVLTQAF